MNQNTVENNLEGMVRQVHLHIRKPSCTEEIKSYQQIQHLRLSRQVRWLHKPIIQDYYFLLALFFPLIRF